LSEINWFIVIGLIFDIGGAVLIIRPWTYAKYWTPFQVLREFQEGITDTTEAKKRNKQRDLILTGFVLLVFGFGLQIVGNLL